MAKKKFLTEKIFGDKTLGDLYKEIHEDIQDTKEQLVATLEQAVPQIGDKQDVLMLLPLITNLFDKSIKNTANLTKVAEILTKTFSQNEEEGGGKKDVEEVGDDVFKEFDALLKLKKEEKKLLAN